MNTSASEGVLLADATGAVGLVFRERMAGGFALGETDPLAGARKGLAADTRFDLRATAEIADLGRFIADPQHAGALQGTVRFAPLGNDLEIQAGAIRLFHRTEDPALKLMEYQFTLRRGTEHYCLSGQKEIRRRRLLHSWGETTTLYCRLHAGPDMDGAVVGAGVLRLTLGEFLKQLLTFRVTHARSGAAKARALMRFARFFASELLDSYAGWIK